MALDISKINFPDQMNIRETALFLGVGEQRIRALVRSGELKSYPVEGSTAKVFHKNELVAFQNAPRKAGGRKEGVAGKAYVIHVTGEKLAAVQNALKAQGIELEPRYNYAKMREYQKKSKANKAARNGEATAVATSTSATPAQPEKKTARSLLGGNR